MKRNEPKKNLAKIISAFALLPPNLAAILAGQPARIFVLFNFFIKINPKNLKLSRNSCNLAKLMLRKGEKASLFLPAHRSFAQAKRVSLLLLIFSLLFTLN
jgi:hypothetical protein